jgi:hypothetical protein
MIRHRAACWGLAAFGGLALAAPIALAAQDAGTTVESGTLPGGEWPMDRVVLTDGKIYQGLVESESPSSIELIEVRRPRGKPMFLVVRPIDRKTITSWDRLDPQQQRELRNRLEKYKQRARIEGRRMENLPLSATRHDGLLLWTYQGQWFSLESTADESMTRRVIVRLEQVFAAYRQLLPPRRTETGRVHVRIFGSGDAYRAALKELGLEIENPAVFLTDRNEILAGSEMNRFDAELAHVNRQHRQVKQELDALSAEAPVRLKQLGEDLKKNEVPAAERTKILLAEQKKWDHQRTVVRRKITALDRQNASKFNDVTRQMFTRLAHEAFHAYLESYVYPRQNYDVPRWLNEGLAQTFEAGLLEADTLRIDTPHPTALAQLQSDLRGPNPLGLKASLSARSETFLSAHAANGQIASRLYSYSWGLAYYLAFEQGVLGTPEFDAYLNPTASGKSAIERFEQLLAMPLEDFEPRWREAMLGLTASP